MSVVTSFQAHLFEVFFICLKKLLWGQGWVVTFHLRFRLRTCFLNFLQPLSWNNIDRRKWWESWPLQVEVGILLGTLAVNRSKIHSYLVKPHHVSIGGVEDPISTASLSPFFLGDRVATKMKNLANLWNYYSQVELVYGLRYLTTLLIRTMQQP